MADGFAYALRVELGENDTPRLKNKLVKYFQSKKSHGGECEVEHERGARTALLRFLREEGESPTALTAPATQCHLATAVTQSGSFVICPPRH